MPGRLYLFSLRGVPVLAHPTYLVLVLLCLTAYRDGGMQENLALGFIYAVGLFVSIVAHEFGHVFAARRFGIATKAIEIYGLGGLAHLAGPGKTRAQSILIYLAGPAVNLLLYLAGWGGLELMSQWDMSNFEAAGAEAFVPLPPGLYDAVHDFGWMNGFLFVFNLLPGFPLDGGRALRAVLSWRLSNPLATRIVAILGMVTGVGLFGLSRNYGTGMLFLCAFLIFENFQAYRNTR